MSSTATHTPLAPPLPGTLAVMQDHDLATFQEITAADYISAGGHGARTVGREAFLNEVRDFLGAGSIQHWSVKDMLTRTNGDVAVCSYLWHEHVLHAGQPVELSGIATDVLVRTNRRWHHQAHHTSMAPSGAGEHEASE